MKVLIGVMLSVLFVSLAQAQTYNCRVFTQTEFGSTTVSTQAVAFNNARRCLTIQNKGASTIFVRVDSAGSGAQGVQVIAGGNWEPYIVPINAIFINNAAGAVGSNTVLVLEGK